MHPSHRSHGTAADHGESKKENLGTAVLEHKSFVGIGSVCFDANTA
ncbi:MAG: hypothetical protein Q8Q60_01590 [Candidatus Chromulinivorax sp.]|nr:hypothetical protein [Candidatus Chromulinivorax sp.]